MHEQSAVNFITNDTRDSLQEALQVFFGDLGDLAQLEVNLEKNG